MYLWDANILRHFGEGHPNLRQHLLRVSWAEIALPSVVVAEVLRGRCDFALKAQPADVPMAHRRLLETQQMLAQFRVIAFDESAAQALIRLRGQHRSRKRYPDMMIAAMAEAGHHVVVTRNQSDFADLLPKTQVVNWIDDLLS